MTDLTFYNLEDRRWPNPRLEKAAIVGHTTDTSARIWVRTYEQSTCWLCVNPGPIPTDAKPVITVDGAGNQALKVDGKFIAGQLYEGETTNATDRTFVFHVGGLQSDVRYYYALVSKPVAEPGKPDADYDWELGKETGFSFRTQGAAEKDIAFGLYSCHMPYDKQNIANMDMWKLFKDTLEDHGADFVIAGGDQVYTDGNPEVSIWAWLKKNKDDMLAMTQDKRHETMVSWYRDIYRGYWGPLALRKVMRNFPTYMIWDDHEIKDGWGSYTDKELSNELDTIWEWENPTENLLLANAMFKAATQVYEEYQNCHNPASPGPGRYDYTYTWGGCAFFVMDMRGNRDFNRKANRVLGKDQLADFLAWMKSDAVKNAKAVFIVSPVPVVHVSEFVVNNLDLNILGLADDLRDEWDHDSNWKERDQVLNAVFKFSQENQGKTVSFLSGDVHIGAAFRLTQSARAGANVYQLTSSAITYFLSDLKRNALELMVREKGPLGYAEDGPVADNMKVHFKKIHTFKRNNFGIIRVRDKGGSKPVITWDLYGNTGEQGQVMKEQRVTLE